MRWLREGGKVDGGERKASAGERLAVPQGRELYTGSVRVEVGENVLPGRSTR